MAGELKWDEEKLLIEISKVKRRALQDIGQAIVRDAKALCPVGIEIRGMTKGGKIWSEREPGTLRASIRMRYMKRGAGIQVIAGGRAPMNRGGRKFLGRVAFYAMWVERGTSRMMGRPYMRPALEKNRGRIMAAFTGKLK